VEARNAVGYSDLSDIASIVCAIGPSQPGAPTTTTSVNDLIISWSAPVSDNGAEIKSYKIFIRESDGVSYSMDSVNCDGSDPTIFAQKFCTVPFSALTQAPFSLTEGSSIYAKVVATNDIGDSEASEPGNGATMNIRTVPDAPVNLARDSITTTTTQIGLLWFAGASDGGQPILDYRIWYDQGINAYKILDANINS